MLVKSYLPRDYYPKTYSVWTPKNIKRNKKTKSVSSLCIRISLPESFPHHVPETQETNSSCVLVYSKINLINLIHRLISKEPWIHIFVRLHRDDRSSNFMTVSLVKPVKNYDPFTSVTQDKSKPFILMERIV